MSALSTIYTYAHLPLAASLLLVLTTVHAQQPNILWLVAEDLSPRLGAYGDTYATTPALDQLASEGVLFQAAFTNSPVCSAVRRSLITGTWNTVTRGHDHRSTVQPQDFIEFYPQLLKQAGYYVTNNSKTDYNFEGGSSDGGYLWDDNSSSAHYSNRPEGTPFMAVFNFHETHESRHFDADSKTPDHDPALAPLPPYYPDNARVRNAVAVQYDNITKLDNWVKEKLEELHQSGLENNTVVFFYGDHGSGLPLYKRWLWDTGTHIPLIVKWPGVVAPGTVSHELVSALDFIPTILSMGGADVPEYMPGRIFAGPHMQPEPEYLFFTRGRIDETVDRMRAMRSRRYKYIRNFLPELPWSQVTAYGERSPIMQELRAAYNEGTLNQDQLRWFAPAKPEEELYDLETDPWELNNLALSVLHEEQLKTMRSALEEWMHNTEDFLLLPEDTWNNAADYMPGEPELPNAPAITSSTLHTSDSLVRVTLEGPDTSTTVSYALGEGDTARWQTYTDTILAAEGEKLWTHSGWGPSEQLVTAVTPTSVAAHPFSNQKSIPPAINLQKLLRKNGGQYVISRLPGYEISEVTVTTLTGLCIHHASVGNVHTGFGAAPGVYMVRVECGGSVLKGVVNFW